MATLPPPPVPATVQTYTLREWTLPLPAALCERIALHHRAEANGGCTAAATAVPNGNGDALPPTRYRIRCNWDLDVALDECASAAGSCDASGAVVGTADAAASSANSPLLSLAELHTLLHFVTSFFPFGSFDELVRGLVSVVLLWGGKISRGPPPADASTRPPLAHPPPRIARARVHAQLLADDDSTERVIYETQLGKRSQDVQLIGRDINPWGDVDILLEVAPAASMPVIKASDDDTTAATSTGTPHCTSCCHHSPSPSAGLYCLNLMPQRRIPLHVHQLLCESELIFSHGVCVQDDSSPASFGTVHSWSRLAHTYFNPTATMQRILCVDVPMFIPSDEIIVDQRDHVLTRPRSTPMPWDALLSEATACTWTFPGGLPTQRVQLTTDARSFETPHAVLLFAFSDADDDTSSTESPAAASRLLFVRHAKRGWELPGGKVDPGETPLEAVSRECLEEANTTIQPQSLRLIAQYAIDEVGAPRHVKSIYAARVLTLAADSLQHETTDVRLLSPPVWQQMFEPLATDTSSLPFSSILRDNVYPLCLPLAQAALGSAS